MFFSALQSKQNVIVPNNFLLFLSAFMRKIELGEDDAVYRVFHSGTLSSHNEIGIYPSLDYAAVLSCSIEKKHKELAFSVFRNCVAVTYRLYDSLFQSV